MNRYTRKMAMILVPSLMLIVGCGEPKPGSADGDTTVPDLKDDGQGTSGASFPGIGGPPAGTTGSAGATDSGAPTFGAGMGNTDALRKKLDAEIRRQAGVYISNHRTIDCAAVKAILDSVDKLVPVDVVGDKGVRQLGFGSVRGIVDGTLQRVCSSSDTKQAFAMAAVEVAGRERRAVTTAESDMKPCDCASSGI